MSLCLCKICLNTKMMFDILMTRAKKDGDETFESVSSFFMAGCSCPKVQNGYYAWSCTIRLCRNCKPLMPPFLMCQDSNDIVSVDQFEKVEREYLKLDKESNELKKAFTNLTERVTKQITFVKNSYTKHKYQVYNDTYQWPLIFATVE